MRTYFIIAAMMGVFAFGSISLLAHAQESDMSNRAAAEAVSPDIGEPAPPEEPEQTGPSPEQYTKDKAQCRAQAYGRRNADGSQDKRPQAERERQFQDCMSGLGYTVEEIENAGEQ